LEDNENHNRILNIVIAASGRNYVAAAAMTPADMLQAGWIVPVGDALQRITALEASVAALEINVAGIQANVALILELLQGGGGGAGAVIL
jgi:hypothetical protein